MNRPTIKSIIAYLEEAGRKNEAEYIRKWDLDYKAEHPRKPKDKPTKNGVEPLISTPEKDTTPEECKILPKTIAYGDLAILAGLELNEVKDALKSHEEALRNIDPRLNPGAIAEKGVQIGILNGREDEIGRLLTRARDFIQKG